MTIYTIHQDGAGNYEQEAETEENAMRAMAEGIVENCENWQLQFATDNFDEAVEKALLTLDIVEDDSNDEDDNA